MQVVVKDTNLEGVKQIITDRFEDYRGEYGGTYDRSMYREAGIDTEFICEQVSFSHKNVLRGMHGDDKTIKLVQCLWGRVYSVVLNCNEASPDFGKWQGFILSKDNYTQLYVPPLYGLSYYVLSDSAVFHYKLSKAYSENQFTYRWNDPYFNIDWPTKTPILGLRDKTALLCSERGIK